jgi:NAD(P)-dependent dehydrogenase (short-subunit alcohol dehydrogenase family)
VSAILPGTTDTALVRRVAGMEGGSDAVWAVGAAQWAKSNERGVRRMATAEEIAAFVVAMVSRELTHLTGSALSADGGLGAG